MLKVLVSLMFMARALLAELDYAESFKEAKALAKKESKGIFVILSKEGCDACWYMENIVFDSDEVVDLLELHYIPLHVDIHNDAIPKGLGFIGTPTMYFLDANGKKLKHGRIDGALNQKEFLEAMKRVGSSL